MEEEQQLKEFMAQFQTEEDSVHYLFKLKWPSGFRCPRCDHPDAYTIQTRRLPLYECMSCRHQTSLIVGTVMEGSKTTLLKWLMALFLISRISSGISALQLSKKIDVTYKTAWLMLHKIRNAMTEADAAVKLCGFVLVNDARYGHTRHSHWERHPREYPLLLAATMETPETPAYIKIKRVPEQFLIDTRISRMGEFDFMTEHVDIDEAYVEFVLGRAKPVNYKKLYPVFRNVNRWIRTTFHGVGLRYLPAYLNEFCYLFNVKKQKKIVLEQLAHLCVNSRTISYGNLIS